MTKVFVGLSGGVDSSVAAHLLKEQGHEVTGVFMKNWTRDIGGFICPWRKDLSDAKRVAVQLGIDFEVFDFETDYKQAVVDYMIAEYKTGHTPNPDIMCNQEIKFKLFLSTALKNGAEKIATGHYVRSSEGELLRGVDSGKDQSYFLYRVNSDALEQSLFPLGNLRKSAVREIAKNQNLLTANKPDSMGICFVGEVGIKDFLQEFIKTEPGPIVDVQTKQTIGEHDGAEFYTIGQRHGLKIGGGLPYYVSGKDMGTNTVYVTNQIDSNDLWFESCKISQTHWINSPPRTETIYETQVRYRSASIKSQVEVLSATTATINFDQPQRALAPGQSAVVYEGDRVVGGGIIV